MDFMFRVTYQRCFNLIKLMNKSVNKILEPCYLLKMPPRSVHWTIQCFTNTFLLFKTKQKKMNAMETDLYQKVESIKKRASKVVTVRYEFCHIK